MNAKCELCVKQECPKTSGFPFSMLQSICNLISSTFFGYLILGSFLPFLDIQKGCVASQFTFSFHFISFLLNYFILLILFTVTMAHLPSLGGGPACTSLSRGPPGSSRICGAWRSHRSRSPMEMLARLLRVAVEASCGGGDGFCGRAGTPCLCRVPCVTHRTKRVLASHPCPLHRGSVILAGLSLAQFTYSIQGRNPWLWPKGQTRTAANKMHSAPRRCRTRTSSGCTCRSGWN